MEFKNMNDWRVMTDVHYAWETSTQQSIIQELRGLREDLSRANGNLSNDLALAIVQLLNKLS